MGVATRKTVIGMSSFGENVMAKEIVLDWKSDGERQPNGEHLFIAEKDGRWYIFFRQPSFCFEGNSAEEVRAKAKRALEYYEDWLEHNTIR